MNKPKYETINGKADTVGELIELLKKVPPHYDVSLSGMNTFGVLIDTENETTLIDDVNFIEEILEENENE